MLQRNSKQARTSEFCSTGRTLYTSLLRKPGPPASMICAAKGQKQPYYRIITPFPPPHSAPYPTPAADQRG